MWWCVIIIRIWKGCLIYGWFVVFIFVLYVVDVFSLYFVNSKRGNMFFCVVDFWFLRWCDIF